MIPVQLLSKGSIYSGKLEKFADGCNSMARSFWLGRKVELLKEGSNYSLKTTGNDKTLSSKWLNAASDALDLTPVGILISPIILIAYVLALIPITITMGVGLAAKKIALANDESSKRYQEIAQKYLVFATQDKELEQEKERLKSFTESLDLMVKELQSLEGVEITGDDGNPLKGDLTRIAQEKKSSIEARITSIQTGIASINKEIEAMTPINDGLKKEIEGLLTEYLNQKNQQVDAINL